MGADFVIQFGRPMGDFVIRFGGPLGACGDQYANLLVVRGNPPENPCGLIDSNCSFLDATAHEENADRIFQMNLTAWNALIAAENELQDWTESEKVRASANLYWSNYSKMPRWSVMGPLWADSAIFYLPQLVQQIQAVEREGACMLERLNAGLAARKAGQVLPPAQHEDPSITDDLPGLGLGVGAFLALGLLLVLASRGGG